MRLGEFLYRTTEDSVLKLYVDGNFILMGETYYFFQDFKNPENDNYNSYVEPYVDLHIDCFEWESDGLTVYVFTKEYKQKERIEDGN